jgi:hypothetical protein
MNLFVHGKLGHFYMSENDGEGNDLPGASTETEEEEESSEEEEESSEEEDDEDGVIVTIGDEKPPVEDEEEKTAPKWVKDLRKQTKEQAKRIRELEQERESAKAVSSPKVPEIGPKPLLSDNGIEYDEEIYQERLTAWLESKRQVDQARDEEKKQQEAQQQEWQGRLTTYAKAKEGLKVRDFDDAESTVLSTLSVTQQGIIVQGADNSALVVYALGKNPAKAKELAGITDAVKFAFAIAKLETQLKVQAKSKSAPAPEGKIRGGGAAISGSVDSNLERLRAEAEKTGDYSKVTQYRKQQREKQKA